MRDFERDQVIAFEEDACSAIGIVAAGTVHIQRIYPSGKSITLETLRAGGSFGEALLFSQPGVYPATLIASEPTRLLFLDKAGVLEMLSASPVFLNNFLQILSNRILLLNRKIKSLSLGSVRQKVANFLLEEMARQKSPHLLLDSARHELAAALGIPRPSLSRELIAMKEEGWIDFERSEIHIRQPHKLEESLGK
jgi:CRP/FNR family transcriptional regulator, dissimilatory nitrate respiration regulator